MTLELSARLALDTFELDVELEADEPAVGVYGPSGSGKTTLLEVIAGWRRAGEARVTVNGRTLVDTARGFHLPERERGVGYVPQDVLLFPHRSVRDNVLAGARRARERGADPAALLDRVARVLELGELLDRRPASLSGGERQRVALARALCSGPDLLLLDEPLGALDRPLRRRILPYLVRLRESFDVPLLLVSHDPTEIQAVCERAFVLRAGRVVASGAPSAVLGRPDLGGTEFETVLRGVVRAGDGGTASVELAGGAALVVPRRGLEEGRTVLLGLRADDVLLAREAPVGLSARNALPASVEWLELAGDDALCGARLAGGAGSPLVVVGLTPGAARELALAPGAPVVVVVKSQSCHVLSTL